MYGLFRKVFAEALGTALLVTIVVGSGIMGEALAGGNDAIALLGNTLATGTGLVVLITIMAPVSGAHFNPVVTLVFAAKREIDPLSALAYVISQFSGGIAGVVTAHAMFGRPIIEASTRLREGTHLIVSEGVATFGLILTILGCVRFRPGFTPVAAGLYITSAYWFTASTSFANPAVTVARSLSDTFAGISLSSVAAFVVAQGMGALSGLIVGHWLFHGPLHVTSQHKEEDI